MGRHAGSLTFRENYGEGKLKKMNLSSSPNPFAGIFFVFALFFVCFSLFLFCFYIFYSPLFLCLCVSLFCLCLSPIRFFFLDKWMLKSGQERCYCTTELRSCVNESRGGRPGLPVPNRPYGFCGRKATLNSNLLHI